MRDGVPQLVVNGRVEAPFLLFHGHVPGTAAATPNAQPHLVGPDVKQVELARDAGIHLHTFDVMLWWPHDHEAPDYDGVDAELRTHLAIDPQALVVPRLHTNPPHWWQGRHADQAMLYDDGRRQMTSVASPQWRTDAETALRLCVRHLEKDFGRHVLGYHVCGQTTGEWVYDESWTSRLSNFEPPFRDGFRAWLLQKYRTREALREAWRDSSVDFVTVELPSAGQRREGKDGAFRDPKAQRFLIDFFEYSQLAIVEPLERFARALKEEVRGEKLVFAFYGYLFDVAGFPNGAQVSGHLLTERVLRCPDIDVLCAPVSYLDREAGGSGPFMGPVDSVQLHGKLWISEDDTRTHLSAENAGNGRVGTLPATRWVHQRNFAHALAHRCGLWWMDQGGNGWLASQEIWSNLGRLRQLWHPVASDAPPFRPDVAVIVDERSALYVPCSNAVTRPLVDLLRYQLNRIGTSVGYYLLKDLCDARVPDAKAYLFLDAFVADAAQAQAVGKAVRNKGKWSVWFYAPGYLDPEGKRGDMSGLTGLPVQRLPDPRPLTVMMAPDTFATTRVPPDQRMFGSAAPTAPAFTLARDTAGLEVLGQYAGTDIPAVACARRPEWSSVFVGSTTISTGVLREIARAAGAHVWLESDDVLIAGADVVAIHATSDGRKELLIPAGLAAADPWDTTPPEHGRHTLTMTKGETRFFRLIHD
jgi:hypothetical protein